MKTGQEILQVGVHMKIITYPDSSTMSKVDASYKNMHKRKRGGGGSYILIKSKRLLFLMFQYLKFWLEGTATMS